MSDQSPDTEKTQALLRELPSVDRLLKTAVAIDLTLAYVPYPHRGRAA